MSTKKVNPQKSSGRMDERMDRLMDLWIKKINRIFLVIEIFDKVLLLGRGGRTVYSGSVENAEPYFASIGYPLPSYMNPADFYMDVIAGSVKCERNYYTDLFEEWEKHQTPVEEATPTSSRPSSLLLNAKEAQPLTVERQGNGVHQVHSSRLSNS